MNDNPCLNDGSCVQLEVDGSNVCQCPDGYFGDRCQRGKYCCSMHLNWARR